MNHFVCLVLTLVAIVGSYANAEPGFAPTPEPTPAPPKIHPMLFVTVGGSSPDVSVRQLGYGLPQNGWYNSVLDQRLDGWKAEFDKRGLPFRLMLHNPWGTDGKKPMDFDQRIEAGQIPALKNVVQSFPSWLETRVYPLLDDGELCLYLGALDTDPDFVALKRNSKAYAKRVAKSLVDVPDWASIAFDHSNAVKPNSPEWATMLMEHACGRRIYCEPRPEVGSGVVGLNVVADAKLWKRTDPERYSDAKHLIPRSAMAGAEVLRLAVHYGDGDRRKLHLETIAEGDTPLFDARDFWLLDEVVK